MSGLEPIAALGLACNILQLVELGCQTIDRIKNVYQGRSLDKDLDENAAALGILSDEVKKETQPGRKKYEKVLLESAEKCFTAAQDLREEVRFLLRNAKQGSLASALKVSSKVAWRKRRLERLKGSLEQAEKQMQSGLLTQIWSSTKAAEIDLNGARQDLRFFIKQYKDGHRQTADLVSSEGLRTREHISHEAQQTKEAIAQVDQKADRIVVLHDIQVDEQARKRFIQSLKYPGLNERRNRVGDAYEDSLKWVFVGDNDDDEASQSNYSYDSDEEPHSLSASYTESESDSESNGGEQSNTKATLLEEADDGDRDLEDPSQLQWNSFSNWLSSTDSIYWMSGKPGSGKTTLVKYVLEHEQTRKHLDIWSSGCMVVSHYFWRPGTRMQKSLEGLFFSLLHQLLSSSATALKAVSSSVSGTKDSHTDWSSAELRAAIQTALNAYEHGVCLFVDGIDEIDPQDETDPGIPEFLDWVLGLSQKEKIKFCLASRPDPHILETSLSKYPRLRLQDLNYQDLMAYAKGHVDVSKMDLSDDVYRSMYFVRSLVHKAEGVFLWLIFATRSINTGINNGDNSELLRKRIDYLPKGLDNLYQDMWDRVGADHPHEYRQTAALYFKALLRSPDIYIQERGSLGALTIMLATTSMGDEILNAPDDSSKLVCRVEILRKCQEFEKKIKIYCFGLVEIVPGKHHYIPRDAALQSWYGHKYDNVFLHAYASRLRFVHRTAMDFLTDTELGQKVLAFDKLSNFALHYRLVKASLACMVLFTSFYPHDSNLGNITFRRSWQGTDDWVPKDWDNLILLLEKLANAGRLLTSSGRETKVALCVGVVFLRHLVLRQLDDQFVISRVKDGALSSNELSDVLLAAGEAMSDPGTFRELLAAGADPNWQGPLAAVVLFLQKCSGKILLAP
ncbi:hypothetical protein N0V93_009777 [Gnomoniopsis smithogilvyi]|uniref:NACHT domain-containing protein n=1 Tax=Gnomoniopsis smithogilvyi TaxID=1191159 RepID=A0A9W9CTZ6_9PEZI|nr:hypothetical protein N0V93_009777 [Gnomoniopsis smithogilvyi]